MADDSNPIDGGTFGGADASLDEWLKDPAAADFIKQKALEHAKALLGAQMPYADTTASDDPGAAGGQASPPMAAPSDNSVPDPTASQGPYVMNKGPATGVTPPGSTPPPPPAVPTPVAKPPIVNDLDPEENPSPVAPGTVPVPTAKPTDTDVSAKKKNAADGISDFAKTLAAVKPTPPPANPAVGTPSVRSPTAMQAPQIAQLMQLLGASSKPSPIETLGRLLVAGKA